MIYIEMIIVIHITPVGCFTGTSRTLFYNLDFFLDFVRLIYQFLTHLFTCFNALENIAVLKM